MDSESSSSLIMKTGFLVSGSMVGASSLSASFGAVAFVGNKLSIPGVFPSSVMPVRSLYSVLLPRLSQTVIMMSPTVPPLAMYLFFATPATTLTSFSPSEPRALIRGLIIEIVIQFCIYVEEVHRGHAIAAGGIKGEVGFNVIFGGGIVAKVVVQCKRTVAATVGVVFDRDLTRSFAEFDHERTQIAGGHARRLTRQRRT